MYRERENIEIPQESSLISRAYEFASISHENQFRKSQEPFIEHPLRVATIIYKDWKIEDENIIAAAILHDTVEDDDNTSLENIRDGFGNEIADLVDGVTKLKSATDQETQKKVMAQTKLNPAVAIIKLADRLDNMRTLDALPPHKQLEKAKETLNVYAPLAEAMGMWIVKTELEDLAFKYLGDGRYENIKKQVDSDPRLSEEFTSYYKSDIEQIFSEANISAEVEIRKSGVYNLYKKRGRESLHGNISYASVSDITDAISIRLIVNSYNDIYKAVSIIHKKYAEFLDISRMDEFIAKPRINGYQAWHDTLALPQGPIELAIMTKEMEDFNNWGVVNLIRSGEENLSDYILKFVFTPDGEVRFLKPQATAIDFAYAINPVLGREIKKVIIDGKEHSPTVVLPNASSVEVITVDEDEELMSFDRLFAYSKLEETHEKIKKQQIQEQRDATIEKGKDGMEELIADIGFMKIEDLLQVINRRGLSTQLLSHIGCKSVDDVYFKIGREIMSDEPQIISTRLKEWLEKMDIRKNISTIYITGKDVFGVFLFIANLIHGINGDVKKIEQLSQDGIFTMRMVVQDLDEESLKTFKERLENDEQQRFIECRVV